MFFPALKAEEPSFPTSPLLTHEIEIIPTCASMGQASPGGIHLSAPTAFPPLKFLDQWSSST